jgi:hypothetical protein
MVRRAKRLKGRPVALKGKHVAYELDELPEGQIGSTFFTYNGIYVKNLCHQDYVIVVSSIQKLDR